jgi:hypothetical protein
VVVASGAVLVFFLCLQSEYRARGNVRESKDGVLRLIPDQYKPKTILIKAPQAKPAVLSLLKDAGFSFPVIFKPDQGERGFMVKKISSESQVEAYLNSYTKDFLIQEFLDLPVELGVFYTRMPDESEGYVNSVVIKDMLSVMGDGKSTVKRS